MKSTSLTKQHPFANALKKFEQSGIRKGMKEGIKQTAINMINEGCSNDLILKVTGLSLDQIEQLRRENY